MKVFSFSQLFQLFSAQHVSPETLAFRVSWKRTLLDLLVLALSGAMLTLSFPGMDIPGLQWISVIPLIALCRPVTVRRAFAYGMVWGYFWNLTATFFLREIHWAIPFAFGAVLGVFYAFWSMLIPVFCRNLLYPAEIRARGSAAVAEYRLFRVRDEFLTVFGLAAWWVLLEWLRSWIFTGFPWGLIGISLWRNLNLIQIAEYTGIYGLCFLIVLMNLALCFGGLRIVSGFVVKSRFLRPCPLYAALLLIALSSAFGAHAMLKYTRLYRNDDHVRYFSVGIVQPDLSQRRFGGMDSIREALQVCTSLTEKLIAEDTVVKQLSPIPVGGKSSRPSPESMPLELIIWPETAVPSAYYNGGDFPEEYRATVRSLTKKAGIPFLIGTLTYGNIKSSTDYEMFNSALLLKPLASRPLTLEADFVDKYDKIHLVPFGEFIPLNNTFPIIGELTGMGRNLTRGKAFRPVDIAPGIHAGIQICYEDVFAYVDRALVRNGANLLLVITNDAWYPASTEPVQHYANSILRSVETRLPMIRCGNSNYSVVIDAVGRTVDAASRSYDDTAGQVHLDPGRQISTHAKFVVPVLNDSEYRPTFYVVYGNLFVALLGIVFTFAVIEIILRQREYTRLCLNPPA